ncbi:helix-turn-helix domain-containing protein [Bacillus haynesii]|uniref:helix-turn-helix domain-containing protein n=1 Tax=Bacillus haynesii TaxID=1925021 RepID=UPI002282FD02|nr:helix-turn-helix domain-containing protein [Bacillus haynesii]MCY7835187.1 helix-turn-helix domain-containing protein [Bacillus haynesii]MCY8667374.1 helix-turn-helix domain-containing protein [Bacillus haynesii]
MKRLYYLAPFIKNEVLGAPEAQEILNVNKQWMSKLISDGRIKPVKKIGQVNLLLRTDVLQMKQEFEAGRKKYRPCDE